jgi:dinuclear metal center YbgI/SA1388 family protein
LSALPLDTVMAWLDDFLDPARSEDYGPNGLQVDARRPVSRIATGVTANLAFLEAATRHGADLAVVHHGLYWHGGPFTVTGTLGTRIRHALTHGLSIAAYHLPLDGHPEVGNGVNLARTIGLGVIEPAFLSKGRAVGAIGHTEAPLTPAAFRERIATVFPDHTFFIAPRTTIQRVGIVTGGAPRMALDAKQLGCDAFITGEASEYTQAMAAEEDIHIAACGHHRTETFGPRALATRLALVFPELDVVFIDVDNPA